MVSVFLALAFIGCVKDFGDFGNKVQPESEKFIVAYNDTTSLIVHTVTDDSVIVNNHPVNLLGSYYDPVFGISTASFATQFVLSKNNTVFGHPDSISDISVVLYLYYDTYYKKISEQGDNDLIDQKSLNQQVNIYQLTDTIELDTTYYNDFDIENYYDPLNPIAQISLRPDSVKYMSYELPLWFAEYLLETDSSHLVNDESFIDHFPGLYLKAEPVYAGGIIYYINLESTYSQLTLFYTDNTDTITPKKEYSFLINQNCAKINLFEHDYRNSTISGIDDPASEDSIVYIQSMNGLKAKIEVPFLESWLDSTDIIINKAELIFTLHENNTFYSEYLPNEKLILSGINDDADGTEQLIPSYIVINSSGIIQYTGESYDSNIKGYSFNIASYLQNIIKVNTVTTGFYLYPANSAGNASRVVLNSGNNSNPVTLKITYSKI